MLEIQTHLKRECFKIRFSNGKMAAILFGFWMVGTAMDPTIQKPKFQIGRSSLGRFIYK